MYDIKLKPSDTYRDIYHYTSKNEAGQILFLELQCEKTQKHDWYYVKLQIGKRKQGFQFLKVTGKDGLKSLIWAKNCIEHFIEYIKDRPNYWVSDKDLKSSIVIHWDDTQRQTVYLRGLKTLKFYYGVCDNRKSLICDIN